MKKRIKKKKKTKINKLYLFLLLFLYLSSFFLTIKLSFNKKDNSKILKYLIESNSNYIEKEEDKRLVTKVVSYIANVDLSKPLTLINNNYKDDLIYDIDEDLKVDKIPDNNYVKDPYPDYEEKNPIVYIYNTHQGEEYAKSNNEDYNIKPTVMTLSYILREKLKKNNISSIVEENDVLEFLRTNNWNYASSYKVTKILMNDAKEKNNSLKYFIDLHRDSVNKNISTVIINDISYAKILFIVGLENPNYNENLKFTEELNNMFNEKYPNLSRGIYKKKGPGVNGVYNQDFSSNTILIEVGGEENTIDEVFNTAEAINDVLSTYIRSHNEEEK